MSTHIIQSADALSAEWFTDALRGGVLGNGVSVTAAEIKPIGSGQIARMVRAELSYDGPTDAPASAVVKFPSDDEATRGLARAMGMYELEVRFYDDIAPLLENMSVPQAFVAEIDAESGMFTIVLEDLSASTRPGDVLTPCTPDECASVLAELVKFQAPLWNSPEIARLEWLSDPQRTLGVFDAFPASLEPFLERFGHGLESEHIALYREVLPQAGTWVRNWTPPTVIQHGDFRTDNVMWGIDDSVPAVSIVDFQTVRLGPPGVDPAYFLACSLPVEERRRVERDLIGEYHEGLLAAGVDGYDFDACWSDYREGAMYGVLLFAGSASQVASTERGDRIIIDQARGFADMAIDLEASAAAGLA